MPRTALTEIGLRNIQLPNKGQVDVWDSLAGFGCRVSSGGSKTFVLKYKNRRISIGRYPIISLSEARTEAKRMLAEFTLGKSRPRNMTYDEAVTLFLEEKTRTKRPRTVEDYRRRLGRLRFPGQLTDISHQEAARQINKVTAPSERAHLLIVAKVFFNWCIKRRFVTDNPFMGLSGAKSAPRTRILSDDELKATWLAADKFDGHFGSIVKLLILTAQRCGEIGALRPGYFSGDTCTLPAAATKNNREHIFPLGPMAAQIIADLGTDEEQTFLFPARGLPDKPFNGWSKGKATLDKETGITGATLHDIRRTVATRMAEMGVAPHVVERLLNHVTGSMSPLARVYNRATFMAEMRDAVDKWDAHIQRLVSAR